MSRQLRDLLEPPEHVRRRDAQRYVEASLRPGAAATLAGSAGARTESGGRRGFDWLGALLSVIIGLPLELGLLVIVTGSLGSAITVLGLVVICTAGLGAAVVLGIAWVLGTVVRALVPGSLFRR